MGPNKEYRRVLRELADVVAKTLLYVKSHDDQTKSLMTGEKGIVHPFLRRVELMTQETIDLSASPLCWERS